MSGDKHSSEPWFLDGKGRAFDAAVFRVVGEGSPDGAEAANWRRIVACVNACAGISTEALEAGALGKALDLVEAGFVTTDGTCGGDDTSDEDCPGCRAVILLRALGRLP